jgi:hypothetical protein
VECDKKKIKVFNIIEHVMQCFYSHDGLLFNSTSSETIKKLIDDSLPIDTIAIINNFPTFSHLENIVSDVVSVRMLQILKAQQNHINLSTLLDIASVIEKNEKCLPPPEDHLSFCSELINQLLSLSTPSPDKFYSFMCGVTKVGLVIEKIWQLPYSPNNVILPCLSNIYTLIANSNSSKCILDECFIISYFIYGTKFFDFTGDNPLPVQTCVFLDLIPNILIEKALEKVVLSDNESLSNLALALCEWSNLIMVSSCWLSY